MLTPKKPKTALAAFLISLAASTSLSATVLFEDRFKTLSESEYTWIKIGPATKRLTNEGAEVRISDTPSKLEYTESAARANKFFGFVDLTTEVKAGDANPGSRGWGFWNRNEEANAAEYALFAFSHGKNYELEGFYALTKAKGKPLQTTKIGTEAPLKWNRYTIRRTPKSVRFEIAGKTVATHKKTVPTEPMMFDFWVDNAIWDFGAFKRTLIHNERDSTLVVKSVTISDPAPPTVPVSSSNR